MQKKIVYIFDFDGTFYTPEKAFVFLEGYYAEHRRELLPRVTDLQYQKLCKEFPKWEKTIMGSEIVNLIIKMKEKHPSYKIFVEDFWDWQNAKPYPLLIDKKDAVKPSLIKKLCKRNPVYVVSNSSPTHVLHYMKVLGIDDKWFKDIISNRFEKFDRTKKHYYQDIMKKERVPANQFYVIGDSEKNDLEPAKKLGMNTFLVKEAKEVKECLKLIKKQG